MRDSEIVNTAPMPEADRPITSESEDEFGFAEIAKKLAPSLIAATKTDGMVVGIEGKWGSGKTSLLNFLTAELEAQGDEHLHVIQLPPWLHGDANALIEALFSQMIPAFEKEEDKQKAQKKKWLGFNKRKASKIAHTMGRYAAKAGRSAAPLMKIGGVFVPTLDQIGNATAKGSNYLDKFGQGESVTKLKERISDYLEKSNLRFIVLLDDLDRLEPIQTTEVIRLIRSVADFSKVVYCLCYDRDVLKHALEHGLNVEDGHAYLQKIVQQTFTMPLPEPFDLRNALQKKLHALYENVNGKPLSRDETADLASVVDSEGNSLEVPRDITLVMNAVKFSYPQVKEDVYFPDLCWIQLVKAKRPALYHWIEEYLGTRSVVTTTLASVNESSRKKAGEKLKELLPVDDVVNSPNSIWHLKPYLPGIEADSEAIKCVFQQTSAHDIRDFIIRKRIGSPTHYRIYFAFAIPKIVMPDDQWDVLERFAIEDTDSLTAELIRLAGEKRPVGGSWFSHVIDRLDDAKLKSLSSEALAGWALATCNSMDTVLDTDNDKADFTLSTATKAVTLIQSLMIELRKKDNTLAAQAVVELFSTSPSMNWLIGDLLRHELRNHGEIGNDPSHEKCALTLPEVKETRKILKNRLKDKSLRAAIGNFPDLAGFLYGWRELAGIRSPKAWVKQYISDDHQFLKLLMALRGWAQSSKTYYPLRKSSVEEFLDWEETLARVEELKNANDGELSELADEVLLAIKQGKDDMF